MTSPYATRGNVLKLQAVRQLTEIPVLCPCGGMAWNNYRPPRIQMGPSNIDAITQLPRSTTVKDIKVLVEMGDYIRKFVSNYSTVVAQIYGLLRDPQSHGKRAKCLRIPWDVERTRALKALGDLLKSPLIVASPEETSLSTTDRRKRNEGRRQHKIPTPVGVQS